MRNSYNFKCADCVLSAYEALYTKHTMAEFLRRCLKKAIADKNFFETVYFLPAASTLDNGKEINQSQGVDK